MRIARAPRRLHQVKFDQWLASRKGVILHAQQANYREWNIAHGLHAAESDPTGIEVPGLLAAGQFLA